MPRRNTIRADDLDFEIHVDPSCLSDPMDDNENKAPEEPKVQDETTTNQETEPLNTHIDKEDHDHSTAEAKVDPTTEATGEDKSTIIEQESDQSAIPEAEAKVEPASESEHESSDSDSEIESDHEAEPQVTLEKDNKEPIQEPLVEADELASEAEIDTLAPEPSLDDTEDKDDEEPTPVENVTVAEDTTTEAPIEDTSSADISTQDISVPDATAEDLDDDDEPVEEDKDKSSAEFEESIADIEERQFSETESEISGSRRVSSGSSGSSYSDRQSTRSEAIQEVARDIASQIDNHEKRESLDGYSEVDDDSYISHAKTISARQSNANMARSVKSGVDEGGENSSHHEHEDDVFSDRSPRSSVGSVSEGDHRKAQDAMHRMTRSPRVSGISGISGFSEYDREDEDFIPTIRGNPRPIFRSPSSVKAMQMSSPPGSTVGGSPRSGRRAPLPSSSRMSSPRFSEQYSPKRTPPRFKRSTPPLVLLHVTLLPLRWPWGEVLENADPEELSKECKTIKDAWRTLQNRMADTTVERGILLPHPQNDYEVLEERLLEALELPLRRRARILECGHYLGPSNMMTIEDSDSESDEDEDEDEEEAERRRESRRQSQPTHWCKTCKSDIHYESLGQGKIFRVKVYASNGLIRGGAWEACWKEMERVDVELEPLVDAVSHHELVQLEADQERDLAMREAEEEERYVRLEEERREFESRERGRVSTRRGEPHGPIEDLSMDESHAADITKDAAEQSRSFDDLEKDIDEHLQEERERSMAASTGARSPDTSRMDEPSISPKAEYQKRDNAPPASENHNEDAQRSFKSQHGSAKATKDSLPELLAESARVLMQDKKNILIGLLSILIVLLAIRGGPGSRQSPDAFEFIRNEEVPTVTVTQAMGLETINPIEEVTASVAAAVEEESGVESDLPEESVIVEGTPATEEEDVAEEDGAEDEQVKSVDDSSAPSAIGDAIPSLEAPSCSERIVRVVETVTSVETATVYAERPSVETQAAEAVSDEEVEEEQAENDEKVVEEQAQESVLAEAEVVSEDSEDSKDSKDSEVAEASAEQEYVEEAPPSEETILVSEEEEEEAATVEEVEEAEEADEAKETKEEQAAQVTAPPAIDSFSDLQDETPSKSAAPKAWWFGKAAPEQTAGALEEEKKHEEL
ncbi:hypothetical protein FGSG_01634 [Fusarium graminearum PH-1]|uniref:Chromosome 1, complete genome n=1 Tax=Gibberella zeae (strain ATCC MYA-4620 / CBS 123657 / FGSC 9075 / NRRL 31084 / PH-1) TaxID=229533 RepID=I1RDD8_GIBZE|nr:hypothetical protein FGSG_01634 [Fusarium graminearum PH-1]ESU06973.1 hypothetical protein FGSG_01634 [Fusarium graminearum PH-1]EYB22696.1 hypothetical protein FG05_01634 [Fusarium graminearum]CAF3601966.1 unnamed protein product [Fusarium graminearum]CEF73800.1 unnamed protein product [Fusarium graminearum]|eukprot:XP_011317458.1 hypothetical protein FGSG_01634 [Fusarium graminearum PH-1]